MSVILEDMNSSSETPAITPAEKSAAITAQEISQVHIPEGLTKWSKKIILNFSKKCVWPEDLFLGCVLENKTNLLHDRLPQEL